jgi:cytochrome c oxidase cbb3-type subunit III
MPYDKEFDGIRYSKEERPPLVFRVLYYGLWVWGLCFMAYYLFSGWSSYGEFAEIKKAKEARLATEKLKGGQPGQVPAHEEKRTAHKADEGKKDFGEKCASCHGADGKGGIGPDLTKKQYKYGRTAPEVTKTIVEGRPGGMPAFGNQMSRDKIEGLVEYVLSL